MVNATGWEELYNGQMIMAAFTMYDTALLGWTIAILFFVFQFMLYMKTRNLTITFVMGLFFLPLFGLTFVRSISLPITVILLVFELGGILYFLIWK